jgi:hypothetical protein
MLDRVRSISKVILETKQEEPISSFARGILNLLERVEYRVCDSGEDFEAVRRLRYKSYLTHGLVTERPEHVISDYLDEAPNCYRFGVFIDGELASTMRIHHVTAAHPLSPAMTVFDDLLLPRLLAGETFVDPSRLAADPDLTAVHRGLPYITLRLAVLACDHFDTTSCLSKIREEHQAFYRRVFGSMQLSGPRPDFGLAVSVDLFEANCVETRKNLYRRFPFFVSSPFERRLLFQRPRHGEPAPLTVLPTAKYSLAAA